mgnify:CR=1 FL=1
MIFFPSAGNRHRETGALAYLGSNGYCWMSSVSMQFSRWSEFQGSQVCLNEGGRSNAFSLRCVQAFTGSGSG